MKSKDLLRCKIWLKLQLDWLRPSTVRILFRSILFYGPRTASQDTSNIAYKFPIIYMKSLVKRALGLIKAFSYGLARQSDRQMDIHIHTHREKNRIYR